MSDQDQNRDGPRKPIITVDDKARLSSSSGLNWDRMDCTSALLLFMATIGLAITFNFLLYFCEDYSQHKTVAAIVQAMEPFRRDLAPTDNSSQPNAIKVVSYNIFNIPYFPDQVAQLERTCRIPENLFKHIPDADVIVVQEMFQEGCHSSRPFETLMAEYGWSHHTRVSGKSLSLAIVKGGVQIFSKWPILEESERTFRHRFTWHSADVWCNKGLIYAKIDKKGKPYHIFGTHMQSLDGKVYHKTRISQAKTIASEINRLQIPSNEPVIIGGDFNTDLENVPTEAHEIISHMKMDLCERTGSVKYTYDRSINDVVTTLEEPSWLDYIVYSKLHKNPTNCKFWSIRLTSPEPFKYCRLALYRVPFWVDYRSRFCLKQAETINLSDHYPVIADFVF